MNALHFPSDDPVAAMEILATAMTDLFRKTVTAAAEEKATLSNQLKGLELQISRHQQDLQRRLDQHQNLLQGEQSDQETDSTAGDVVAEIKAMQNNSAGHQPALPAATISQGQVQSTQTGVSGPYLSPIRATSASAAIPARPSLTTTAIPTSHSASPHQRAVTRYASSRVRASAPAMPSHHHHRHIRPLPTQNPGAAFL